MEKIRNKALSMNLRKGILRFIACSVVLAAAISVMLFQRFGNRLEELRSAVETEGNYENNYEQDAPNNGNKERSREREKDEDGGHELKLALKTISFSSGDAALLGISAVIALLMAVWYLALCMAWAYQKAHRMGLDSTAWVIAALFFHLAAIAVLYLYAGVKGVCANCGKVIRGSDRFCSRCGNAWKRECPRCGQTAGAGAAYCSGCGAKLDEEQENDKGLSDVEK